MDIDKLADFAALLHREWPNIQDRLRAGDWQRFQEQYRQIVRQIPDKPETTDVVEAAKAMCKLLERHTYTAGLLRAWMLPQRRARGAVRTRGKLPEPPTDPRLLNQVCNRFRELADHEPDGAIGQDTPQRQHAKD